MGEWGLWSGEVVSFRLMLTRPPPPVEPRVSGPRCLRTSPALGIYLHRHFLFAPQCCELHCVCSERSRAKEHMHKGVASRTAVRGNRFAVQARRTGARRTRGGERRRKSECGSAERFVVSPEEVGSLCVISKVSSEAQRRLARSSDTRRGQRTLQRQRGNKFASLRPLWASQGNSSHFSCYPVSSSCACASAACIRTRSSDTDRVHGLYPGGSACLRNTQQLYASQEKGGGERPSTVLTHTQHRLHTTPQQPGRTTRNLQANFPRRRCTCFSSHAPPSSLRHPHSREFAAAVPTV